jgi:hypothetical protein
MTTIVSRPAPGATPLFTGPITRKALRKLYGLTAGRSWEPPDPNQAMVLRLIAQGYIRRTDGRCGFERLKDAMVTWTEAGHMALFPEFVGRGGDNGG